MNSRDPLSIKSTRDLGNSLTKKKVKTYRRKFYRNFFSRVVDATLQNLQNRAPLIRGTWNFSETTFSPREQIFPKLPRHIARVFKTKYTHAVDVQHFHPEKVFEKEKRTPKFLTQVRSNFFSWTFVELINKKSSRKNGRWLMVSTRIYCKGYLAPKKR